MIIGIDASRAAKKNKTGTEWYSYFLIEELKKISHGSSHKVILYSREPLSGELAKLPPNWENRILTWPPKYLWTNIRLSWEMAFNPPDVLFIPAHSVPLVHAKNTVVTWHDIGFEKFKRLYSPQAYYYHKWTVRYSLRHAKKVIVISQFTKDEIKKTFRIKEDKMKVVYNGYDTKNFHDHLEDEKVKEVFEKYKIKDSYIFYIGRLEEKKNILGLVKAFKEFKDCLANEFNKAEENKSSKCKAQSSNQVQSSNKLSEIQNVKLVLAGRRGYGYERVGKFIKENKLENEVIELGWTAAEDIPYLMRGACMFCFLSFYEGFGIPVLEAMACGTPVVASDIPVLHEVAEDAALFADPNAPFEISQAMKRIVVDENLRNDMSQKGLQRAKKFSYEKCARETWEILRSLA